MKPVEITKHDIEQAVERGGEKVYFDYHSQAIVLTAATRSPYVIKLEFLTSTAELLDYVLQIQRKHWCRDRMIREFFRLIEAICRLQFQKNTQGVFCPYSQVREEIRFGYIENDGRLEKQLSQVLIGRKI